MTALSGSVVITGCSRGIGLELVSQYAKDGWCVLATARNLIADPEASPELRALAERCERVSLHSLDVSQDDSIAAFRRALEGQPVDLLINNAGI